MNKRNPVKKNMDKLHKPKTHTDKTKYKRVNADWSYDANGTFKSQMGELNENQN